VNAENKKAQYKNQATPTTSDSPEAGDKIVRAKTTPAKKLLADHRLPMDANTFNNGLILAGVLEVKKYLSTTGSGEEKYYIAFTEAGSIYGKNIPSGWHEFKTEPKYYDDQFAAAYLLVATTLFEHAKSIIS
jgi:hypothetical protein